MKLTRRDSKESATGTHKTSKPSSPYVQKGVKVLQSSWHLGKRTYAPLEPIKGDGVMGSMSARWKEWKGLGAPRLVVQWLGQGIPLKWKGAPPEQSVVVSSRQPKEVELEIEKLIEGEHLQKRLAK